MCVFVGRSGARDGGGCIRELWLLDLTRTCTLLAYAGLCEVSFLMRDLNFIEERCRFQCTCWVLTGCLASPPQLLLPARAQAAAHRPAHLAEGAAAERGRDVCVCAALVPS